MSFLDATPLSPTETEALGAALRPALAGFLRENLGIDKDPEEVIVEWARQVEAGYTPAGDLGLKPEHIDALLAEAHNLIRAGQLVKARDRLRLVLLLNPLEPRAAYAVAATLQMERRYTEAAQLYAAYITMEPTDVKGVLRFSECLLGQGEIDEAREFIDAALAHAREEGDTAAAEQAQKLLGLIDASRAVIRADKPPAAPGGAR